MGRLAIGALLATAVVLAAVSSTAQCTVDFDCKGDRICQKGECVAPPEPAPAPVPAEPLQPPPPLMPFQSGYGEISLAMSFYTWGGQTWEIDGSSFADPEFEATTKPLGGVRMAGYAVLGRAFHLGGYFAARAGEGELKPKPGNTAAEAMHFAQSADSDVVLWGLGATAKLGGRVAERVWLGGGVDVGLHLYTIKEWDDTDDDTFVGLEIFPRLVLDIILVDNEGFRLALPISAGAIVSPFSVAEPEEDTPQTRVKMWHVAPAATVGVALGS